jgi:hypothetical protein
MSKPIATPDLQVAAMLEDARRSLGQCARREKKGARQHLTAVEITRVIRLLCIARSLVNQRENTRLQSERDLLRKQGLRMR